jgi:hypothetical protein
MQYIRLDTFDYNTFEGFKINHQRELPKKAFLHLFTYDIHYNNYAIYRYVTKKCTKVYILKSQNF